MSTFEDEQEQSSRGQSGDGVLQQISKQLVVPEDQEGAEPEAPASPGSSCISQKQRLVVEEQDVGMEPRTRLLVTGLQGPGSHGINT
jgi:hypothetical protein